MMLLVVQNGYKRVKYAAAELS